MAYPQYSHPLRKLLGNVPHGFNSCRARFATRGAEGAAKGAGSSSGDRLVDDARVRQVDAGELAVAVLEVEADPALRLRAAAADLR